ncbi:glutathione transferase [Fragilaria crotonensis]|nr:glutathione transferase [Fragilaria crotonensis]
MPASYEVSYFDAPGRAEPIRVMLHAAGVEFKDNRFKPPEWPATKPTTPLGAVPTLKIDDVTYCQSLALARYAAKLAGFYPADPLEALVVDEVMDTCNEILNGLFASFPQEKKRKRLEWQEGPLTKCTNLIESRIQASGGVSVAKAPSVADLMLKGVVDGIKRGFFDYIDATFFDNYPGILATCDAIAKDPKVKAYYDSLE